MKNILFVCKHNASCSQMAAAYFNHINKKPDVHAISAGTFPSSEVSPATKRVLQEDGIDTRSLRPKPLTKEMLSHIGAVYKMDESLSARQLPVKTAIIKEIKCDKLQLQNVKKVKESYRQLKKDIDRLAATI